MLYTPPALEAVDHEVLGELDSLRESLRHQVSEPRRWTGALRRTLIAAAIRGSNSIEGYQVTQDDAEAAVRGDDPLDTDSDTWSEITGYRDSLTYVQQLADNEQFAWEQMLLSALHFMLLRHHILIGPGRYRKGPIYVSDSTTGTVVYRGPEADRVPELVDELCTGLAEDTTDLHVYVRAAMAHLNLVSIHPWRDGNGRMSRCLHTLVLARDGVLAPEFSSIEEWLGTGRNTYDYYDALRDVQRGVFEPHGDTLSWVRFCLRAHHLQAQLVQQRFDAAGRLWSAVEDLVTARGLPERTASVLFDAAMGSRVRRTGHQRDEHLTLDQAVRDLRELLRAGLLEQRGQTRGRHYVASDMLRDHVADVRADLRPPRDPYAT
ncbi:Fic family protein [Nocardia rhizosphaerae]|uniref:Fic family protein n=1 Tax=Nocardia rhizosphaerae TaxID=1691571 RepID=A0ABV8LCW9_9NOCA